MLCDRCHTFDVCPRDPWLITSLSQSENFVLTLSGAVRGNDLESATSCYYRYMLP